MNKDYLQSALATFNGGNGISEMFICGGAWETAGGVNGFRLIPYSGNIDTVTVSLFGIAES